MIDNRYIEAAQQIRQKFISLSKELDYNRNSIKELSDYLFTKVESLEGIKNRLDKSVATKEEIIKISNDLLLEISEIEDKEKSMTKNIDEVNKKMEKLKQEELNLMKLIKEKYPKLSNDEIRNEVHSRL